MLWWRGGTVQCLMGKSNLIQSDKLLLRAHQLLMLLNFLVYNFKTGSFALLGELDFLGSHLISHLISHLCVMSLFPGNFFFLCLVFIKSKSIPFETVPVLLR